MIKSIDELCHDVAIELAQMDGETIQEKANGILPQPVWYLGDSMFATEPEELIGYIVRVEEPRPGDEWNNSFVGRVDRMRDDDLVVIDQEDNAFQVDPLKVEVLIGTVQYLKDA